MTLVSCGERYLRKSQEFGRVWLPARWQNHASRASCHYNIPDFLPRRNEIQFNLGTRIEWSPPPLARISVWSIFKSLCKRLEQCCLANVVLAHNHVHMSCKGMLSAILKRFVICQTK